jgi:voltage-gated potassium channel
LQSCEIDIIHDEEKIDSIRREVGLSIDQTRDIVLQLIRERKEEEAEREKNKYCFCPHCGHKLPE